MNSVDDVPTMIRRLRVPASAALDEKVLGEIAKVAEQRLPLRSSASDFSVWQIIRIVVKNKPARYTLATSLSLALIAVFALHYTAPPAWAIEQAVAALQKFKAIQLVGHTATGSPLEIWARANESGTRSDACLAKLEGFTVWVKDNQTYTYDHAGNTVYVEPGITAGTNPWFGPKFLTTMARMPDYQALEGHDPATGQARMLVTGSIESVTGPQSYLIEFDVRTKLPVSTKRWDNLTRQGAPAVTIERMVYFEDLPDSAFTFAPPPGVQFAAKPLTIPEENVATLSDPNCGMPADGLTQEEACRRLLERFWTAWIADDLPQIHQLCPLTARAPTSLLRELAGEEDAAEVLTIGGVEQNGQSSLGPLALVPSRVRCKDGKVRDMKMVVQFRHTEQGVSCVIHGPYGYSFEVQ